MKRSALHQHKQNYKYERKHLTKSAWLETNCERVMMSIVPKKYASSENGIVLPRLAVSREQFMSHQLECTAPIELNKVVRCHNKLSIHFIFSSLRL